MQHDAVLRLRPDVDMREVGEFLRRAGLPGVERDAARVLHDVNEGYVSAVEAQARRLLFPDGVARPTLGFELTLVALDARVEQVVVEVAGRRWRFGSGARQPLFVTWSAGERAVRSAVRLIPAPPGRPAEISADGPWGWWRLVELGRAAAEIAAVPGGARGSGESQRLSFVVGERRAVFELTVESPADGVAGGGDALQGVPEGFFKRDAGAMAGDDDGAFNNPNGPRACAPG